MERPYSTAELEALALRTLQAVDGYPLLVGHAVCLIGLIGTLVQMRQHEALDPTLETLLRLAAQASRNVQRMLAEGPYDGLPVA